MKMNGEKFMKGIYSALPGVFDENGIPDVDQIKGVVRHNIEHCDVDGLYVCGSTGENFLINTEAKKIVLKSAAEAANNEVSLIAHIGSNVIEEVLELADVAAKSGYDAISAVTPYYYKFTADEIKDYYKYIAEHSELPLVIYSIPLLTGVTLSREDLLELFEHEKIIGVKYTANDFYTMERIRTACKDVYIYSGFDEMLLSAAVLGTDGAIGSTYNIIGHWAKQLMAAVEENNLEKARQIQTNINTVVDKLIAAGLYQTLKEVLALYGIRSNGCKMPMSKTTDKHREYAKEIYSFIEKVDQGD